MISDLLSKAGYNCGYVGKWHMGNDAQPGHGYKYTYTMIGGQRSYTDPEMSLNGEMVKEKGYLADLMTQRACEFLDKQSAGDPFFLTVGYLNPHTPYYGPSAEVLRHVREHRTSIRIGWEKPAPNALREKDMLKDIVGNLRKCAASTTALDDQIPVLIRKLQETKALGQHVDPVHRRQRLSARPARLVEQGTWHRTRINMYDEVMKVPMILSWPGKIPTGEVAPEMISFYDVLPTLVRSRRSRAAARTADSLGAASSRCEARSAAEK